MINNVYSILQLLLCLVHFASKLCNSIFKQKTNETSHQMYILPLLGTSHQIYIQAYTNGCSTRQPTISVLKPIWACMRSRSATITKTLYKDLKSWCVLLQKTVLLSAWEKNAWATTKHKKKHVSWSLINIYYMSHNSTYWVMKKYQHLMIFGSQPICLDLPRPSLLYQDFLLSAHLPRLA